MYQSLYQKMCEESRNLSKETYKNKLKKIIRENERSLEIKKKLIKGEKKKLRIVHCNIHGNRSCTYNHFVSRTNKGRTLEEAIMTPKGCRGGDRVNNKREIL